jgi:hypothetical protein
MRLTLGREATVPNDGRLHQIDHSRILGILTVP